MPTAKRKPKPKPPAKPKPRPAVRAPAPTPTAAPAGSRPGVLAIGDLKPSPTNPRKSFPAESLQSLADSIRSVGVRQRILVRPIPLEGHPAPRYEPSTDSWVGVDYFEIVAGERRHRAALAAGLDRVPVDVCNLGDEQVLLVQLVENDQREDVRPSEQAAAYRRLADAGRTAEQIAADTGKPVGFVRGLLRLGRLPAWALAAVDGGTLPRATAELVARVPGEDARKRCAACAMMGFVNPADFYEADLTSDDRAWIGEPPLSYRDTKDLIRTHFTKELKGSPFSLKVIDLVPGVPSCEACPKRAGNDAEATAEGTRADVCLDPDCYRAKVEAFRAAEVAKAWSKGIGEADVEVTDMRRQPRGWLFVDSQLQHCAPELDVAGLAKRHADRTLKDLLAKPVQVMQYLAFGPGGKPVRLVRTAEARKALQETGVLAKPEPRPKRVPSIDTGSDSVGAATESPKSGGPLIAKVSAWEVDEKAGEIAAGILREYTEGECSELDGHEDAHEDGPIRAALELSVRSLCYDLEQKNDPACGRVLKRLGNGPEEVEAAVSVLRPSQLLALLVELAATIELQFGNPYRATGQCMLAFADLDWAALQEQARRVLTGGESAEAKVAAAEAEQNPTPVATVEVEPAAAPAPVPEPPAEPAPSVEPEEAKTIPAVAVETRSNALHLRLVPGFPVEAANHLAGRGVQTVADLDAKVAEIRKQPGQGGAVRYDALRELDVPYEVVYAAGDALTDWDGRATEIAVGPIDTVEAGLRKSLHTFEGAAERWEARAAYGLSDSDLKAAIAEEFGTHGSGSGGPGCKWCTYKGGKSPSFWFDNMSADGKPTLSGAALVNKVREVMGVPAKPKKGAKGK